MIRFHGISRLEGGKADGIHLLWSPPWPTGHSLDGFTIYRRDARGEKSQLCFDLTAQQLSDARAAGYLALPDALIWAHADKAENALHGRWTYRIELVRRHSVVTVSAANARAAFAGTADGAVIAGETFHGPQVTLRGSDIGIVWLVTDNLKDAVRICGDVPNPREWLKEKPIVKHLQVPFHSVNASVGSPADGRTLAASRATPEPLNGDFDEVSRYANSALERPGGVPAMRVVSERPGDGGNSWDVSPFGLAVAPTLLAPWRRGWGFAHLDNRGLTSGQSYDYRIVGHVPRADRDEIAYDLHTVPRGYRLPINFRWGNVNVWSDKPPVVRAIDTFAGDPATIRKGFDAGRLSLYLDVPTERLILDTLPGSTLTAKGYRYGLPVGAASAPTGPRALLDFGTPVDVVIVEGSMAVAGIVPLPLDPALDPRDPVEVSQTIYDIAYVPTAGPDTPSTIGVINLADPARTAARGVHDSNRGFAIDWAAPPSIDPAALAFFPVSSAATPTDVAYYILERTWKGRPFTPADGDGMQVSGRNSTGSSDTPAAGFDLLRAFPPANAAPSTQTATVHAVEVFEPDVLSYGDDVTYQVSSVDATGRLSAPRVSAPTPLRLFVRPPAPTTPPSSTPVDPDDVPRSGVQVTLLQADDPDLTAAQSAVAAGGNVVLVRWGWGPDQRELHPEVSEFRIYRHDAPLTAIDLSVTGTATANGGGWTIPVAASRPLVANEFAGVTVVLGAAYTIVGHGSGASTTVALAANPVDPSRAPTPATLVINRTSQAELNSEYWDGAYAWCRALPPRAPPWSPTSRCCPPRGSPLGHRTPASASPTASRPPTLSRTFPIDAPPLKRRHVPATRARSPPRRSRHATLADRLSRLRTSRTSRLWCSVDRQAKRRTVRCGRQTTRPQDRRCRRAWSWSACRRSPC